MFIIFFITAMMLESAPAKGDLICRECNLDAKIHLNFTFHQAFQHSSFDANVESNILLADLRPGICETTLLVHKGKFYAHKKSRSILFRNRMNSIYLRHKEFFVPLLNMLKKTKEILNVEVPEIIFNLETQDNPTCRYPKIEIESGRIRAVKGLFHHSFCSPKLCDEIFLFPISYNQNFVAMEARRKAASRSSRIPWEGREKKIFWRGSRAGKKHEYAHFDWKFSKLPRDKAVEMCKSRKDSDVKFGFVNWKIFLRHKYILALAGNTYSSLFKHALGSGSCILRQEERMYEWFEPFLKKWIHYIPVKWDLSDLFTQIQWAKDHDEEAKEISVRAKALSETLFTPKFMACYIYCLLLQYRSKLKIDLRDQKILDEFTEVYYVCNSKRDKRNECVKL